MSIRLKEQKKCYHSLCAQNVCVCGFVLNGFFFLWTRAASTKCICFCQSDDNRAERCNKKIMAFVQTTDDVRITPGIFYFFVFFFSDAFHKRIKKKKNLRFGLPIKFGLLVGHVHYFRPVSLWWIYKYQLTSPCVYVDKRLTAFSFFFLNIIHH